MVIVRDSIIAQLQNTL